MYQNTFKLKPGEVENAQTQKFEANVEKFCTGNTVPLSKEAVKFLFDLLALDRDAAQYLNHYYGDVLHGDVDFGSRHISSRTDSSVLLPYLELHQAVLDMTDEIFNNDITQRGHGFHALLKTAVLYGIEPQDVIRNSSDYEDCFDAADIAKDELLDSIDKYETWTQKIKDYISKYLTGARIKREITFPMISQTDIEAFKKITIRFQYNYTRAYVAAKRSVGARVTTLPDITVIQSQLEYFEDGRLFPVSTNYDAKYRSYFLHRWEGWYAMGWTEEMDIEEFFNSKF